jgi:hypothetical protein
MAVATHPDAGSRITTLAAVGLITQHPGLLPVHAPKARDFTNRRYRH